MKLAALLSWYAESPAWLRDMVASLPAAGVTHLVAVDGAYARYPGGQRQSDDAQHKALIRECKRQRIALTVQIPDRVWDTEMEKRTALFRLAETVNPDWYMVMDGDELIDEVPDDLHRRLEETDRDNATVTFSEPHPSQRTKRFSIPILFRAIPGLEVVSNHYCYRTPDGRDLWGQGRYERPLDLTDLTVLHRTHMRSQKRKQDAKTYYAKRDEDKVEIGKCRNCGEQGVDEIPYDWKMRDDAPPGQPADQAYMSAVWVAVCEDCRPELEREGREQIMLMGQDPSALAMTPHLVEL